jgi:protein involved in polysaccharide export with SLBB domain
MYPKNYYFFRDTSATAQAVRNGLSGRIGNRRRGAGALVAALAATILVAGCFSRDPMRLKGSGLPGDDSAGKPAAPHTEDVGATAGVPVADDPSLDQLWHKRSSELSSTKDYPIGPGDVLTVSVPQMDELQERKVRVTPQGTIELPLVGAVQAGGMTEEQLEAELDHKLNNFMYNPQAAIYVNEYHNREVAVIGSVNHPGLVLLTSPSETILDVLTQAGGLSSTAADEIILIPVEQGDPTMAKRVSQVAFNSSETGAFGADSPTATDAGEAEGDAAIGAASSGPVGRAGEIMPHQAGRAIPGGNPGIDRHAQQQASRTAAAPPQGDTAEHTLGMLPSNAHPLSIPIKSTSLTGAGKYINLPMRPGDVIVVPGGGNVMVVGWVQTPGYFQVGSGLTVLGAIGAAGGPMYAANTKDITLIRSNKDGSKDTIAINLDKISKGDEADLPVKANDVIDVPYSSVRIGPYVFYSILSRMGLGTPAW